MAHIGRRVKAALPPSIQSQRDNLSIGLYLAHGVHGATLDQILQVALGYSPNGPHPVEEYSQRFRNAQRVGRDAFRRRLPGYFTFNAMPFGGQYVYKATWYVWVNPQTRHPQTVPIFAGDLASMRRVRERDLSTRQATARSIRTADDIADQRRAIQGQDWQRLRDVQTRMLEDDSLGEILSGCHGLPYADIQEVIPHLQNYPQFFQFQRDARNVQQLGRRLKQAEASLSRQLTGWVMLQTGVPNNAPQLALQQAQQRLASL